MLLYKGSAFGALPLRVAVIVRVLWILFVRSEMVLCAPFALENGKHEAYLKLELSNLDSFLTGTQKGVYL